MEIKLYQYDTGTMTYMAAKPIFGKNPLKIFLPGTRRIIRTNLVCSIRDSGPIVCLNNDPVLIMTYFSERSKFLNLAFIY